MNIRNATLNDLKNIIDVYDTSKKFMYSNNLYQWDNKYPSNDMLIDDINKSRLYVIENNFEICGVFMFCICEDETYNYIEGKWLSNLEYGVIHRVASNFKIKGIFKEIIKFCESKINHLRIDTHKDNLIMNHLILKYGFIKCGIIYVKDKSKRIAYEKI